MKKILSLFFLTAINYCLSANVTVTSIEGQKVSCSDLNKAMVRIKQKLGTKCVLDIKAKGEYNTVESIRPYLKELANLESTEKIYIHFNDGRNVHYLASEEKDCCTVVITSPDGKEYIFNTKHSLDDAIIQAENLPKGCKFEIYSYSANDPINHSYLRNYIKEEIVADLSLNKKYLKELNSSDKVYIILEDKKFLYYLQW